MKKIISSILLIIIVSCAISPVLAASDVLTKNGIGENLDIYNSNPEVPENLNNKAGVVLGIIRAVGTIVSVGVLMVLGIKYMMGSVEEKAEYKKTFTLYIIGAILLFAGSSIPSFIYDIIHK